MKKLFANASYSFNNFYNNLNTQGQMVFSLIMILIFILCIVLFITYIFENIKNKSKISKLKNETKKYEEKTINKNEIINEENDNLKETKIEDIANAIEGALKDDSIISLTNFEEDQEKTAIISIDELMQKAKELELIDDEEPERINYLEKYNLEPAEVEEVVSNTVKPAKEAEVKAFKVSQVISPIYGIKKDIVNDKEA